jgi:hypothetical protein
MTGGVRAAASPIAIDLSNPDRRSITARHSANSRYTVMNTDKARCTELNAEAVCMSTPRGIFSAKYAGLTTM